MLSKRRSLIVPLLLGLLVAAIDQISKHWALGALQGGKVIPIIGDFLSFKLTFNSGAAFSFGDGTTWIFTIIAFVVVLAIPYFLRRTDSFLLNVILGIVWGGALGNFIDRIFRAPGFAEGHVVDFINYNGWFIGNIADIALVAGLIAVVIVEFFVGGTDSESASDPDDSVKEPDADETADLLDANKPADTADEPIASEASVGAKDAVVDHAQPHQDETQRSAGSHD